MKISQIVNGFRRSLIRVTRLQTNPFYYIRYWLRSHYRRRLMSADIPGTESRNRKRSDRNRVQERLERFGASFNRRFQGSEEEQSTALAYRDSRSAYRRRPQDLAFETNRRIRPTFSDIVVLEPSTEEIPALVATNEIRGRNGRYKCVKTVAAEKKYRIYYGVHSSTNKPVVIKEYLLPEIKYNREERRICKRRFASIVDIDLKSIGGQDFRVVFPLETISPPREKRCYLVTESIDDNITLKQYLEKEGALIPKQVVKLLDQVLQTLWFIHTNRLRLSSSEIQNGIAHGNLSLNSVLVDVKEPQSEDDEPELLVYLTDLALWEHIFIPPNSPVPAISPLQDLKDLGSISASLLIGKTETDDKNWFLASEDEEDNWLAKDEVLGRFILRLLGISSKFESALVARQELLQLEREGAFDYQQELQSLTDESEPNEGNPNNRRKLKIIALTALVLFLIGWAFVFFNDRSTMTNADESVPCCIAKVKPPEGEYDYAAENGIWSYVLEKSGFTSKNKNLREELEIRQPILEDYNYEGVSEHTFAKLNIGSLDFALGYWQDDLPDDLEQEVVAFHGLAVFVAFSDNYRAKSIPRDLKGKISIKDLRTLYTRGADDWRLPRKLRDWDVKLYVPFEKEAIALFKHLLFPDEESAVERRQFDSLTEEILARQYKEIPAPKNYSPTTRSVVENVFLDYENNNTVGIGFGYFNSVFGQCAVYPLAVAQRHRPIQPYATSEGKPITPKIDLCNDKGGYILDASEFNSQKYPLSQKLVVIYPKEGKGSQAGRQFAKLLKTKESQYLLEEAGIVPLQIQN